MKKVPYKYTCADRTENRPLLYIMRAVVTRFSRVLSFLCNSYCTIVYKTKVFCLTFFPFLEKKTRVSLSLHAHKNRLIGVSYWTRGQRTSLKYDRTYGPRPYKLPLAEITNRICCAPESEKLLFRIYNHIPRYILAYIFVTVSVFKYLVK